MDEIDTYVVPCSILKRCGNKAVSCGHAAQTMPLRVEFTCICNDPTHTIQMKNTAHSVKHAHSPVVLPLQCLFLMPNEVMDYTSLPDLGIYIRATMTKRFFTSTAIAHNAKVYNMFTLRNKKGIRKKQNLKPVVVEQQHWTEVVSKSWCVSLLQETIPCLDRYKRGFRQTYNVDSVSSTEVQACISVMYGTLLKLYPRGSKIPIFSARVNIICRIQELLEQSQEKQMEFIKSHSSLLKLCLMEYCYNVFLDFFPVEYSFVSSHPCMPMYRVTAK